MASGHLRPWLLYSDNDLDLPDARLGFRLDHDDCDVHNVLDGVLAGRGAVVEEGGEHHNHRFRRRPHDCKS